MPYAQISPNLKRAVIVTEDAAFFDHDGIDLDEIKASLEKNWEEGQFLRGASTITQQLAKNLYLSPSRNPMRKVTELLITRRLEAALTKRRIFEIYLNMIEWGDGIFGCEAAARAYFGKTVRESRRARRRRCWPARSSTRASTAPRSRRGGCCGGSRSSCGGWRSRSRRRQPPTPERNRRRSRRR